MSIRSVDASRNGMGHSSASGLSALLRAVPLRAPHLERWAAQGPPSQDSELASATATPYTALVLRTAAETEVFIRYAASVCSESGREEFIDYIAANPEAGKLIRGSGGCRKVRWSSQGRGKQGGARVIYFLATDDKVWLLIVFKKAEFDNLSTEFAAALIQGVEDAL